MTAEPSEGPTGRLIRSLKSRPTPEEEESLFMQDRREHVQQVILPALKQGRVVICDRYMHSSAAYQGARGLDPELVLKKNVSFAPIPDIVFLLDVSIDIALERIRHAREGNFSVFEMRSDLEAVDSVYKKLRDPIIKRIDANRSIEEIHSTILEVLREMGCACTVSRQIND